MDSKYVGGMSDCDCLLKWVYFVQIDVFLLACSMSETLISKDVVCNLLQATCECGRYSVWSCFMGPKCCLFSRQPAFCFKQF